MYYAFRKTAADGASALQRAAAALTRERLVSDYCHGGIVIGDRLYHVNTKDGLHSTSFDPEKWDLFYIGDSFDKFALILFSQLKGTKYDWFSLLAFAIPYTFTDSKRLYCFEWMALASGLKFEGRVTPEMLLKHALTKVTDTELPHKDVPTPHIAGVPR